MIYEVVFAASLDIKLNNCDQHSWNKPELLELTSSSNLDLLKEMIVTDRRDKSPIFKSD